jgi:decaprenylphospho-beta-D-erythro-pentofuranosid-2-ulose 2-reductase
MSTPNVSGQFSCVLLLGGTSEIGLAIISSLNLDPAAVVILAGRDVARIEAAGKALGRPFTAVYYDAMETGEHQEFADHVNQDGAPDLVIAATGILIPQEQAERDVRRAAAMIETNFTGHVTALLAFGEAMRRRGSGTIVVLSSVAAVRPRKFNSVYGATKAGLDAFARGYADSLHGTGVRVLLVRPGFVTGRMTEGMKPAPLATTPQAVGAAVASALRHQGRGGGKSVVWVPAPLVGLATVMKLIPRPVWRKLEQLSPGGPPDVLLRRDAGAVVAAFADGLHDAHRAHVEDVHGERLLVGEHERTGVHDPDVGRDGFLVGQAGEPLSVRVVLGVGVVDAVHSVLGDEQRVGFQLKRPLHGRVVGGHVGLADAACQHHDEAAVEVMHGLEPDERLGDAVYRYRGHHPDIRVGPCGERAPQHERVHHGAEHADVVRFRPADPPPLGHPAPEVVPAADDDRDLDAEVVHRQHLVGDPGEARGIDTGSGGPR